MQFHAALFHSHISLLYQFPPKYAATPEKPKDPLCKPIRLPFNGGAAAAPPDEDVAITCRWTVACINRAKEATLKVIDCSKLLSWSNNIKLSPKHFSTAQSAPRFLLDPWCDAVSVRSRAGPTQPTCSLLWRVLARKFRLMVVESVVLEICYKHFGEQYWYDYYYAVPFFDPNGGKAGGGRKTRQ